MPNTTQQLYVGDTKKKILFQKRIVPGEWGYLDNDVFGLTLK